MKFSRRWLEELLATTVDRDFLVERLTLAGLEVDDVESLALDEAVVVADVVAVAPHPDADKLRVCEVHDGDAALSIVCGAPNVRPGLKVALARVGARLPGGLKIRKSKLRGVESAGMLCSAAELGLGDEHDGILELPGDWPVGTALATHIELPDDVIDVDLTPNRGDCFSLLGIARETAAFADIDFDAPPVPAVAATSGAQHGARVDAPDAAPVLTLRVVTGIDPGARTPWWMRERLRRSGIRCIHPVVDITNYVMLEYGQPMHAYDRDRLRGDIVVRPAHADEPLALLDGRTVSLAEGDTVIADDSGAIGLAGIMGGTGTGVTDETVDIVFEAAWFSPDALAGVARRYGLHTDASLRFERGVDPHAQVRAQERAAALLRDICGGEIGAVQSWIDDDAVPQRAAVTLRAARLEHVLGTSIEADVVDSVFARLGLAATRTAEGWTVVPPGVRFDVRIEEDLIEEVARVVGYDRIPMRPASGDARLAASPEQVVTDDRLRDLLAARGLREVVSYSFVDPDLHEQIDVATPGPTLLNPISSELSVMRGTLLCGLAATAAHNIARQQHRLQLFEIGHVFGGDAEPNHLAVLLSGSYLPEHWSGAERAVDFFDGKRELEVVLDTLAPGIEWSLRPGAPGTCLHPGQSADIVVEDVVVGYIGALHPGFAERHLAGQGAVVFELDIDRAARRQLPMASRVPKHPAVRRDLAVLVPEDVSAGALQATVRGAADDLLKEVIVFDIYRGDGVEAGLKSIALGLILQDSSSTLTDEQVAAFTARVTAELDAAHGAKVRE